MAEIRNQYQQTDNSIQTSSSLVKKLSQLIPGTAVE